MNRRWQRAIIAAAALAAAIGCAGSPQSPEAEAEASEAGGASGGSSFPSADALEDLAEQPSPDALTALDALGALDVESWELTGPFPERIEVAPDTGETMWDSVLAEAVRRRVGLVVPTDAMRCVARELGLFYLSHRAGPSSGLQRYIAGRCRASVPGFRFGFLHGEIPESVTEETLFEEWREPFAAKLEELTSGEAGTAGVWFGRRGEQVVLMAAAGRRRVYVEPTAAVPGPDGHLTLGGEVLSPVSDVSAIVSRGRYGVAHCAPAPDVRLPRFAFDCELDPEDESAIVSLSYMPVGRVIGKVGLNVLVWPSGRPTHRYQRPSYGDRQTVASARALGDRFVALLNDVRRDAGLAPLAEARDQSEIASELAPHFFSAMFGESPETILDMVALGMIAGWRVDGILQSGHFTSSWVTQTNDVDRLLSDALEYPLGRAALLAADVEKIAVGALLDADSESPVMAAVIGTYGLFSEETHTANAQSVYDRFEAERSQRGLRAARRLETIEPLCMEAAGSVQAGVDPRSALGDLLQVSTDMLQRSVNGWIAEVSNLEDLDFPDDFLLRPSLEIAVGVSYRKPPDQPWGRYVVMLVAAQPRSHSL